MILDDLLEKITEVDIEDTSLYFITRFLKPNVRKSSKVMDKYSFQVYQVDVNDEIREHLHSLTTTQLKSLIAKKHSLTEYDVITDDTEQLFTYSMKNSAMSFGDVINHQLTSHIPKIQKLEDIIVEEELWAYMVGFQKSPDDTVYTFRKILSGKVAIDEKQGNSKNAVSRTLRTIFNSSKQPSQVAVQPHRWSRFKEVDKLLFKIGGKRLFHRRRITTR